MKVKRHVVSSKRSSQQWEAAQPRGTLAVPGRSAVMPALRAVPAACAAAPREETEDGLEAHMATNHLAHFLLTLLLLPALRSTSKQVGGFVEVLWGCCCRASTGHGGGFCHGGGAPVSVHATPFIRADPLTTRTFGPSSGNMRPLLPACAAAVLG